MHATAVERAKVVVWREIQRDPRGDRCPSDRNNSNRYDRRQPKDLRTDGNYQNGDGPIG